MREADMSQANESLVAKLRGKPWVTWVAIAIVAIMTGLLVPQLMQGDPAVDNARTKLEAKDGTKFEYAAPALPDVPNPQGMFVRLGVGTVLVLGLCVATLFGLKRWINPIATGNAGIREMRLKETLPLGNRCSLHLVQLGGQSLLVGVDAGGLKSIVPLAMPFEEMIANAENHEARPTLPMPGPEARNFAA